MKEYSKKDDILYNINNKLTDNFPYSTDYPDYHPHSTIAYLKPGSGKKYVKEFKNIEFIATPEKIVYSKPNEDGSDKIVSKKLLNKVNESIDKIELIPLFTEYIK